MSPVRPESLRAPWGVHALEPGRTERVDVGPLHFWIRSEGGEIRMAHLRDDSEAARGGLPAPGGEGGPEEPVDPEADLEWTRWATGSGEVTEVELRPRLPDRAVVVEPEQAFHLLPGARARVYVRVPLRVQVHTTGEGARPLTELATVQLSDTWWGDFLTGELCYYLPISARRRIERGHFLPHAAVAPLEFVNRSEEDLAVEKLALRVVHLGLFQGEAGFWTDETLARYRGESLGSDLDMAGRAPADAGDAPQVAPPRVPIARSFRARTFQRFRSFGVLG